MPKSAIQTHDSFVTITPLNPCNKEIQIYLKFLSRLQSGCGSSLEMPH